MPVAPACVDMEWSIAGAFLYDEYICFYVSSIGIEIVVLAALHPARRLFRGHNSQPGELPQFLRRDDHTDHVKPEEVSHRS